MVEERCDWTRLRRGVRLVRARVRVGKISVVARQWLGPVVLLLVAIIRGMGPDRWIRDEGLEELTGCFASSAVLRVMQGLRGGWAAELARNKYGAESGKMIILVD